MNRVADEDARVLEATGPKNRRRRDSRFDVGERKVESKSSTGVFRTLDTSSFLRDLEALLNASSNGLRISSSSRPQLHRHNSVTRPVDIRYASSRALA